MIDKPLTGSKEKLTGICDSVNMSPERIKGPKDSRIGSVAHWLGRRSLTYRIISSVYACRIAKARNNQDIALKMSPKLEEKF